MIGATILYVTLLAATGQKVDILPVTYPTRAECRREKALAHAATLPCVSEWRLHSADCVPQQAAK